MKLSLSDSSSTSKEISWIRRLVGDVCTIKGLRLASIPTVSTRVRDDAKIYGDAHGELWTRHQNIGISAQPTVTSAMGKTRNTTYPSNHGAW